MTDRELLEAAAKAAGIVYEPRYVDPEGVKLRGLLQPSGIVNIPPTWWNPLTDDGDALRLAAKRQIAVNYRRNQNGFFVTAEAPGPYLFEAVDITNLDETATLAAIRRAIVRAAAAMAKP